MRLKLKLAQGDKDTSRKLLITIKDIFDSCMYFVLKCSLYWVLTTIEVDALHLEHLDSAWYTYVISSAKLFGVAWLWLFHFWNFVTKPQYPINFGSFHLERFSLGPNGSKVGCPTKLFKVMWRPTSELFGSGENLSKWPEIDREFRFQIFQKWLRQETPKCFARPFFFFAYVAAGRSI